MSRTNIQNLICDSLPEGVGGVDNRFFHDVAGEFVVGEVDEIGGDVAEDLSLDCLGAVYDQVLHYVVPELAVTQRDSPLQYFLNYGLVLKLE